MKRFALDLLAAIYVVAMFAMMEGCGTTTERPQATPTSSPTATPTCTGGTMSLCIPATCSGTYCNFYVDNAYVGHVPPSTTPECLEVQASNGPHTVEADSYLTGYGCVYSSDIVEVKPCQTVTYRFQ